MADEDLTEDDTLIDQLLADGFTYASNGRVEGLATDETDPEPDDGPVPGGDPPLEVGDEPDVGDDAGDVEPDADSGPPGDAAESPSSLLSGIAEDEARGLLHLRQVLIANPDLAARVNRVLSGEPEPEAAPAPPEPPPLPEAIDPDDQTTVFLWNELQKISSRIDPVQQQVQQSAEQATQARINSEINEAVGRFKASHPDLDDTDIQNIRNHTSANVNIPGVMGNFPGDPVEGLTRALEIGSLTDPATRDKVLGTKPVIDDQEQKDQKRMRDQAALSGGSGGTRRAPPPARKPRTWNEVAQEIGKSLSEGSL